MPVIKKLSWKPYGNTMDLIKERWKENRCKQCGHRVPEGDDYCDGYCLTGYNATKENNLKGGKP